MLVNKKHPAYSTTAILPTESVAEFEKLHKDLISELVPNGALADDIVATITRMVWRKRNLLTFRKAEFACVKYKLIMRREFSRMLPEQTPPCEFQGEDYSEADAKKLKTIDDIAIKELGDDVCKLATIRGTATVDGLMEDLELRERLNATIEKGMKRLLFVKELETVGLRLPRCLRSGSRAFQERRQVRSVPCLSDSKKVILPSNTAATPRLSSFPEKASTSLRSCAGI